MFLHQVKKYNGTCDRSLEPSLTCNPSFHCIFASRITSQYRWLQSNYCCLLPAVEKVVIDWGMVLAIPALGWQYHGFGEWASAHPPLSITFWALSFTVGGVVGKRDALLNFFSTSGRAWYVYPVVGRRESTADDGHAWSSGAGLWLVVSSSLSDCIIRNKIKCTMTGQEWPRKGRKKRFKYIYCF